MRIEAPLNGGCHCGAIRYRARAVFDAGYCHCLICRRTSGVPVLAWANIPAEAFELLSGAPVAYAASDRGARHFCGTCGSGLYWAGVGEPYVSLSLGTLDDPEAVRPQVHICAADKLRWFDIADALPRYPFSTLPHPDKRGDDRE
jgi:hypothetical protein